MNTDNMSVLGLTIDYGPYGFLDAFDPGHICNHSDEQGRYAYGRQPSIAFWNLHALAQALLPLIGESDDALAALEPYKTVFPRALMSRMRAKLGLATERDTDQARGDDFSEVQRLLKVLERPFDEQPEHSAYADFPPDWAQHIEVSCSS